MAMAPIIREIENKRIRDGGEEEACYGKRQGGERSISAIYEKEGSNSLAIRIGVLESMPTTETSAEVEAVACDCCGLTEECTLAYIAHVRERYGGRWICGLCGDAVEEEIYRSAQPPISSEEAVARHVSFCRAFRLAAPVDNVERMIAAVKHLLRRSLDSPKAARPDRRIPKVDPVTAATALVEFSESSFPALAG